MAFRKDFIHLFKLSLMKDVFQLSQGAFAYFELVLDSFILLIPVKAFVDVYKKYSSSPRFGMSSPTLFSFLLWPTTINSHLLAFQVSYSQAV